MNKPLVLVVTGRPASGKSTLARIISAKIKCPLISRDEMKEGYINTAGVQHSDLDSSVALHIYEAFFEVIDLYISSGISIVAEAAFQDKLWRPKLLKLLNKANLKIVICEVGPDLARARFIERLQNDPDRDKFHGDHSVKEQGGLPTGTYEAVKIDVPVFMVDTTGRYSPGIEEIMEFIKSGFRGELVGKSEV